MTGTIYSQGVRQALLILASLTAVAACAPFAPFQREVVDNRDPDRVGIVAVADDGTIELADGRRVRLVGNRTPADPERRAAFLARLRECVGREANVDVIEPGDPAVAEVSVWERMAYCGNGLATWDPDPDPIGGWVTHPLARNLEDEYGEN